MTDTTIDPAQDAERKLDYDKLFAALNERKELWTNIIQTLAKVAPDELNDDPDHASFPTLLAYALREHTSQYDTDGMEHMTVDIYS